MYFRSFISAAQTVALRPRLEKCELRSDSEQISETDLQSVSHSPVWQSEQSLSQHFLLDDSGWAGRGRGRGGFKLFLLGICLITSSSNLLTVSS